MTRLGMATLAVLPLLGVSPNAASQPAHPRLIVTPERRAVWTRMRADYEANPVKPRTLGGVWFKLILTVATGRRYGDNGLWGTLAYQMTGQTRYAELAWARIAAGFLAMPEARLGGNHSREEFIQLVLMYDWLYPALSTSQREQFLAKLNAMATRVVTNKRSAGFPIRAADSDQMVGDYFGLASLYIVTHEYNPTIEEIWHRPYVGGFEYRDGSIPTFRAVIHRYVTQLATGGEWIESEAYNLGTVKLLTLGAEMVRTGTGRDSFPEITALVPDLALRSIHRMTPDLKQVYQWGDEEHPRDLRLFHRVETAMVLAGLTQADPRAGPYLQDLVLSLVEKYGATRWGSAEPWPRGFLVYNPYAAGRPRSELPSGSYAPGVGMLQYRSGWDPSATLFSAHFPPNLGVDHAPSYFGEFQLYRRGEWAITHPLGYGAGPNLDGRGTNSMLIGGLPWGLVSFSEFRKAVAADWTEDWAFIAGTAGGQVVGKEYWKPPPPFLREWTRSLVYLPHADAIVVHDRVNALDPRTLDMSRYRREVQAQVSAIPALKQWTIHASSEPSVRPGLAEWELPSKEHVRVYTLLPRDYRSAVVDERTWSGWELRDSEKKFLVRLTPAADSPWDTFLNVIQIGAEHRRIPRLIRSEGGDAEGVLLEEDRAEAVLLVFNGRAGPVLPGGTYNPERVRVFSAARLTRKAWSLRFDTTSASTLVLAFHLDPGVAWSATLDGGSVAVSKRPSGVFSLRVESQGAHLLQATPD